MQNLQNRLERWPSSEGRKNMQPFSMFSNSFLDSCILIFLTQVSAQSAQSPRPLWVLPTASKRHFIWRHDALLSLKEMDDFVNLVRWRTCCCTKFQSSSLHSFYVGNTPLGQVLSDSALETVPWIFTHSPPLQKTWRIEIWNFSPASQTMLNFKAFRKLMYVGGENSMSIGTLRKGNDLPMYHLLETSEFGVSRKICGTQMWFVTCGCS